MISLVYGLPTVIGGVNGGQFISSMEQVSLDVVMLLLLLVIFLVVMLALLLKVMEQLTTFIGSGK